MELIDPAYGLDACNIPDQEPIRYLAREETGVHVGRRTTQLIDITDAFFGARVFAISLGFPPQCFRYARAERQPGIQIVGSRICPSISFLKRC